MTGRDTGTGALFAEVLAGVSRLVQGEIALARAEAGLRLQSAKHAAVYVVVAIVLGITALNVLAAAAVAGLRALGLGPLWSTVGVGVVLAVLAAGFALRGQQLIRLSGGRPMKTAANLRRDVATLRSMGKSDAAV